MGRTRSVAVGHPSLDEGDEGEGENDEGESEEGEEEGEEEEGEAAAPDGAAAAAVFTAEVARHREEAAVAGAGHQARVHNDDLAVVASTEGLGPRDVFLGLDTGGFALFEADTCLPRLEEFKRSSRFSQ
jgi:hypothetical protein